MMKTILPLLWVILSVEPLFAQRTQVKGFADLQYSRLTSSDTIKKVGGNRGFNIGQINTYITSQITDRFSFLSETVFEWEEMKQDWSIDVERIFVRYYVRDYLNFSVGKFHAPFGYWNNAYHHGSVVQPTISRPLIVQFEDMGGILPIHQVGLQISGSNIGSRNFGYTLFVSNGQEQGNSGGSNNYKSEAYSGQVSLEPVEDLQLFCSGYYNHLPSGTWTHQGNQLLSDLKYFMANAAVAFFSVRKPLEFAVEYFLISNTVSSTSTATAGYAYLGYKVMKKLTPYAVYNRMSFQVNDAFFIKNDVTEFTWGLRYEFDPRVVWKFEYTTNQSDINNKNQLLRTQFAVGF